MFEHLVSFRQKREDRSVIIALRTHSCSWLSGVPNVKRGLLTVSVRNLGGT